MPGGLFWAVVVVAVQVLAALWPLRRPSLLADFSFVLGYLVNELPFVAFYWLAAWTLVAVLQGDLASAGGLVVLGGAVLTTVGLAVVAWRGVLAGPTVARALRDELGVAAVPSQARLLPRGRSLSKLLFAPLPLWRRDVKRTKNIRYGDHGRRDRLDLYRHRTLPRGAPVLIHFHGGHFRIGGKSRETRALLQRLAGEGWICISANYRLRAAGRFPHSLVDAKRVIAWVREQGAAFGADPSTVVLVGCSAGAHLASMAALTPDEPAFQPGFERADTQVLAVIGLYGYYGPRQRDSMRASTPHAYLRPDAPPFFMLHGSNDTNVSAASARRFADALREVSTSPVVYAELPGAQHAFDLVDSVRFEHAIDGIERFLDLCVPATAPRQLSTARRR